MPDDVYVASSSSIKIESVRSVLEEISPGQSLALEGLAVPSGVSEQPFGRQTVDGALNRLAEVTRRLKSDMAVVAIENGLFRIGDQPGIANSDPERYRDSLLFVAGADLSTKFDNNASYEDRAVVALHVPGYPLLVQLSPIEDAVEMPIEYIQAAHDAPGSFDKWTAGVIMLQRGAVQNHQDPHSELTNGRLSRKRQITDTLVLAFEHLDSISVE